MRRLLHRIIVGCGIFLLVTGCTPRGAQRVPATTSCRWNLEPLGRAIAEYREQNGEFRHRVTDLSGETHSWRICVLPYVLSRYSGSFRWEQDLHYRFDQAWNSEHNRVAVSNLPWDVFHCPHEPDHAFTSYLVLVRSTCDGDLSEALPPDAVLIVESVNCGVRHAEPKDLQWQSLWEGHSPFGKGKLNSRHPNVVKALRMDGTVIDIPKTISKERLRKLLSGSGER